MVEHTRGTGKDIQDAVFEIRIAWDGVDWTLRMHQIVTKSIKGGYKYVIVRFFYKAFDLEWR